MEIWNKLLAFWCSRVPSSLLSKWHVSDGRRQYKAGIRYSHIFLPCLVTNWIQEILDYTQLWNGLNRSFQGALQQEEHIWLWCGKWFCKRQIHWNSSIMSAFKSIPQSSQGLWTDTPGYGYSSSCICKLIKTQPCSKGRHVLFNHLLLVVNWYYILQRQRLPVLF